MSHLSKSVCRAAQMTVEQLEARRLLSGEPMDFGDAPDSYATTLAMNGARHFVTPNLLLGNVVDPEPDGQPDINALRDDINGPVDDEDGVLFVTPIIPGAMATVQVTNGAGQGVLNAWMDFNANGTFDATERIISNAVLAPASVTNLNFPVPPGAVIGETYARFRLAATFDCPPIGPFGFGEVEDYKIRIEGSDQQLDFGDAPDFVGSPFQYPTTFGGVSGDPARHVITPNGPRLGLGIDPEPDGQPNLTATGDDLAGADDEDGITVGGAPFETFVLTPGAAVPIQVTNTGAAGLLNAWFDWNQNGTWEAVEQVATNLPTPPGVTILPVVVPAGVPAGTTVYSRFRLSTLAGLSPKGLAPDGEVEDYANRVGESNQQQDFGDAPDSAAGPHMYATTFAGPSGDPARHLIVPGAPRLGASIDPEADGQPNLLATGDDAAGIDDEDGVTIGGLSMETVPLQAGAVMPIEVTNGGGGLGFLNAWFDWNQNGLWEPATEQVALGVPIAAGATIILPVSVPGFLTANSQIYSRFRLSSTAGISFKGAAPDGEVEDYRNRVLPDTTPPTVTSGGIEYETRQAVRLNFSEPINPASVAATDLSALNTDDGTTPVATSVFMGPGNLSATWVFNTPGTFINDGDYTFTLAASAVSDIAGNGLSPGFVLSGPTVFWLAGDANRDRTVNLADFNIMAAGFGTAGNVFSQGNFDYDAAGLINLADFNILAANFGVSTRPGNLFGSSAISANSILNDLGDLETMLS